MKLLKYFSIILGIFKFYPLSYNFNRKSNSYNQFKLFCSIKLASLLTFRHHGIPPLPSSAELFSTRQMQSWQRWKERKATARIALLWYCRLLFCAFADCYFVLLPNPVLRFCRLLFFHFKIAALSLSLPLTSFAHTLQKKRMTTILIIITLLLCILHAILPWKSGPSTLLGGGRPQIRNYVLQFSASLLEVSKWMTRSEFRTSVALRLASLFQS